MTPKEKFFCLVANDALQKAGAIVILEGDGLSRITEGARLYQEGWAPTVVISGGVVNPPHSIPAREMLPHLLSAGVSETAVLLEEKSQHTRAQAEEIVALALEREWKKIILVASHYHQYRAYLTFLRVLQEQELDRKIVLISAPARQLPWFAEDAQGRRVDLLDAEMQRIDTYREKGHIASYESALEYLEWKESQA